METILLVPVPIKIEKRKTKLQGEYYTTLSPVGRSQEPTVRMMMLSHLEAGFESSVVWPHKLIEFKSSQARSLLTHPNPHAGC